MNIISKIGLYIIFVLYIIYGEQSCAVCPDTSMQVLFGSGISVQQTPTTMELAKLSEELNAAQIKTVHLRGSNESSSVVRSYLQCPNLKLWFHSDDKSSLMSNCVVLNSGDSLSISLLQKYTKGKFIILKSPFQKVFAPLLINNGTPFVSYQSGLKNREISWFYFLQNILLQKKEVIQSYHNTIGKTNRWDFKHNGAKELFVFGSTPISLGKPNTEHTSIQSQIVNNHFYFSTNNTDGVLHFYNAHGQKLYTHVLKSKHVRLPLSILKGASGTILCRYTHGENTLKTFTIVIP